MLERRDKGLAQTARDLGLDPFEVIRLAVAGGSVPDRLRFSTADAELLGVYGGIERWWPQGRPRDDDGRPVELLRSTLQALLERDHVDDRWTRLDNLWNDLRGAERVRLRAHVGQLVESGILVTQGTPHGVAVAVSADHVDTVRALAQGSTTLSAVVG